MSAVEIPSPKAHPSEAKLEDAQPRPVTASFTSTSTLSSVPISTQSSSRRITTRSGIQGITNSDSGSAESSSEDELADASTFILPPRKRVKLTPSPPAGLEKDHTMDVPSTAKPPTRRSARASEASKRSSGVNTPRRDGSPVHVQPVYKYSLMALVKQRESEEKTVKKVTAMEQEFAKVEKKREEERLRDREAMSGLKAAVADDSDEGERMMLAMQRTGAMEGEEKFYYLGGVRKKVRDEDCPIEDIYNPPPWLERLKDKTWRTHACLSGFVAEAAVKHGLPRQIQYWMAEQMVHEKREDLCQAYVSILQSCGQYDVGSSWDGADTEDGGASELCSLQDFYRVRHDAEDSKDDLGDSEDLETASGSSQRLAYVVPVICHFSACHSQLASTLLELMFAKIDANVESGAFLTRVIDEGINDLLRHADVRASDRKELFSEVTAGLTSSKLSIQLKCRAIAALPAHSFRTHALRRHLALQLIHCPTTHPSLTLLQDGKAILADLKTAPNFAISESTDYDLLNRLIQVLDIAIDSGFDPQANRTQPQNSATLAAAVNTPEDAEKAFNAQIDAFVAQLNLMASRIKDAGTTHLRRTQAKGAIERLAKRLEYGVRTKPRPRKGIFANGIMDGEGQREFLKGFLKFAEEKVQEVEHVPGEDAVLMAPLED